MQMPKCLWSVCNFQIVSLTTWFLPVNRPLVIWRYAIFTGNRGMMLNSGWSFSLHTETTALWVQSSVNKVAKKLWKKNTLCCIWCSICRKTVSHIQKHKPLTAYNYYKNRLMGVFSCEDAWAPVLHYLLWVLMWAKKPTRAVHCRPQTRQIKVLKDMTLELNLAVVSFSRHNNSNTLQLT